MDAKSLYSPENIRIMEKAEWVRRLRKDRVMELVEFARRSGMKKVGIAYCISFGKEAGALQQVLESEGLTVEKVHCKYGHVAAEELVEGGSGIICNPAGQAQYLSEQHTEMNIVMGLCLGHDMVFNARSKAPATTFAVKDRQHQHQPLQGLQR